MIWKDADLLNLQKKILCDDSTGFGEVDKYFATEVDAIIGILYEQVVYRLKTYGGNMLVSKIH